MILSYFNIKILAKRSMMMTQGLKGLKGYIGRIWIYVTNLNEFHNTMYSLHVTHYFSNFIGEIGVIEFL